VPCAAAPRQLSAGIFGTGWHPKLPFEDRVATIEVR
jgi:hypothetical protein